MDIKEAELLTEDDGDVVNVPELSQGLELTEDPMKLAKLLINDEDDLPQEIRTLIDEEIKKAEKYKMKMKKEKAIKSKELNQIVNSLKHLQRQIIDKESEILNKSEHHLQKRDLIANGLQKDEEQLRQMLQQQQMKIQQEELQKQQLINENNLRSMLNGGNLASAAVKNEDNKTNILGANDVKTDLPILNVNKTEIKDGKNETNSTDSGSGISGFFNNLFGGAKKNNTNNSTTNQDLNTKINSNASNNNSSSLDSLLGINANKMSKTDREEAELETAPKGLILKVILKGMSNLNTGQLVDGNLNPLYPNGTKMPNAENKSNDLNNSQNNITTLNQNSTKLPNINNTSNSLSNILNIPTKPNITEPTKKPEIATTKPNILLQQNNDKKDINDKLKSDRVLIQPDNRNFKTDFNRNSLLHQPIVPESNRVITNNSPLLPGNVNSKLTPGSSPMFGSNLPGSNLQNVRPVLPGMNNNLVRADRVKEPKYFDINKF